MIGINIYSGSGGLGSALTNSTSLAKHKGKLELDYPVRYKGKVYKDAEAAYQALKTGDHAKDDELMARVICAKLLQHPRLKDEIKKRGGAKFILHCSHYTYATTARFQAWEGQGIASRFIRNLAAGYLLAEQGGDPCQQGSLSLGAQA